MDEASKCGLVEELIGMSQRIYSMCSKVEALSLSASFKSLVVKPQMMCSVFREGRSSVSPAGKKKISVRINTTIITRDL